MAEVTDAVNGVEPVARAASGGSADAAAGSAGASGTPDRLRKQERLGPDEPPPFDSDAT